MSLLVGPDNEPRATLYALWKEAHKQSAGEPEALSFWQHLFAKHEFKEEHWICDAEIRPEPQSRSRIDRGIRFLTTGAEIIVLCWHEAKGGDSSSARKECEEQARVACQRNLESHPWQETIYAFTTMRTKGKAWTYNVEDRILFSMHDDEYIEANSTEGHKLRKCFERMKAFPPAKPAGAPNSNIATQRHFVQTSNIAAAPPGMLLSSDHPPLADGLRGAVPTLGYGVTAYPAQTYTNPIFPSKEAGKTLGQVRHEPKPPATEKSLRQVTGMKDPRDPTTFLYKVEGGWKATGPMERGEKDGKSIVYSRNKGIWFPADDLRK